MKLRSESQLMRVVEGYRRRGLEISFANGCFDMLHVGHVRYLQSARQQGDRLVVGLNNDKSVRRLKGEKRPLIPELERAEILSALEAVDDIVLFSDPTVDRLLLAIRPDVHCKGSDYTEETVPERQTVLSYGGRVAIVGGPKVRSTRDFVGKIQDRKP